MLQAIGLFWVFIAMILAGIALGALDQNDSEGRKIFIGAIIVMVFSVVISLLQQIVGWIGVTRYHVGCLWTYLAICFVGILLSIINVSIGGPIGAAVFSILVGLIPVFITYMFITKVKQMH